MKKTLLMFVVCLLTVAANADVLNLWMNYDSNDPIPATYGPGGYQDVIEVSTSVHFDCEVEQYTPEGYGGVVIIPYDDQTQTIQHEIGPAQPQSTNPYIDGYDPTLTGEYYMIVQAYEGHAEVTATFY